MYRIFHSAVVFLVLASPVAWAQQQFWVTVGSFQSTETAEQAREKAVAELAESFAVVGAQTGKGYFYRVASGPYATREQADERLQRAWRQGYPQAWIWADDSSAFGMSGAGRDEYTTQYSTDFSSEYGSTDLDLGIDLGDYPADLDATLEYDETLSTDTEVIDTHEALPVLVDDAPPGYQLNRMRRDG
jgi:hypothetical protein